jgi:hypothetical protein
MKTLSMFFGFVLVSCLLFTASQSAQADLIKNASDIKYLGTPQTCGQEIVDVLESTPEARSSGIFTVPDGKYLVITTVTITPDVVHPGEVTGVELALYDGSVAGIYGSWTVPLDHTFQLQFPTGFLVAPGLSLKVRNGAPADAVPGDFCQDYPIRVRINGYLVKQK